MDDSQDSVSAKSTEQSSQPVASVSEITTDQSTATPVTMSSWTDTTSASAHGAEASVTLTHQDQIAQPAIPSQGEFPLQTAVSGPQLLLSQGRSNHHPVDSQR